MQKELSSEQLERYSRQIIIPEIGSDGQMELLNAKLLVIGAGGLGSAAINYLSAAGVGGIGVVDSDRIELSNLNRQVLHSTKNIGQLKTDSVKDRVRDLNPDIKVDTCCIRLTGENIIDMIHGYDITLDCSDNFPTRYLINDACILSDAPLIHGAVSNLTGQAMTIIKGKGPCFRCVFREAPPEGVIPVGQNAGILGAVAGLIGAVQATEAIKYILGIGDLLVGKLLTYDSKNMDFRKIDIFRDKNCPVCGDKPTIVSI